MFAIVIIFLVCAAATGMFIVLELNWSIRNFQNGWKSRKGPFKIIAIAMIPLYGMPIILDVLITIGVTMFLGAEGMMGLMTSMVITSSVGGYLFYKRRKHGWIYF